MEARMSEDARLSAHENLLFSFHDSCESVCRARFSGLRLLPPVRPTVWLLIELFLHFTLYSSTFQPLSKVISQHLDNSVNPTPTHILVFQLKYITKKHYSSTRPSATLMQYTAVQLHFIQCHFACWRSASY